MSIDLEEIRDQIIEARVVYEHLVDPVHYRASAHQNNRGSQTMTAPSPPEHASADNHSDYIEVVTWRHLSRGASIKYVCLQSLGALRFTVAATQYFSTTHNAAESCSAARLVAERLKSSAQDDSLAWFPTLEEAMDAHDASL
ncbi:MULTISPECIES: hypothetical protein [Pseudomonas]|uniref:Uncharacterized protein n=1 Tax=Pseudomonas kurunegalensis TaxID=485880 RepID=A0ACC5UP59_9PSED|nr:MULTISPECIES: hypothetical protein [Pseudomonas]MBV4516150.1 hypothetical protein [Pseudomonas kurunegalensis]